MFGADFLKQFGLGDFPFQGIDPQGGLLGTNVPMPEGQQPPGSIQQGTTMAAPQAPAGGAPAAGTPPLTTGTSPLSSPLAPGQQPQTPQSPPDQTAPASGINSQFGKSPL